MLSFIVRMTFDQADRDDVHVSVEDHPRSVRRPLDRQRERVGRGSPGGEAQGGHERPDQTMPPAIALSSHRSSRDPPKDFRLVGVPATGVCQEGQRPTSRMN